MTKNNGRNINILLIIITIIGIAVRLWAGDTQLTHDELSALARTHFDSFHDLIYKGICIDGHPAAVQILLWLWTQAFGYSEWVVRLPFFLMGCACIPLIFSFVKRWSNDDAALWAASTMAFSEYAVLYTNIARPYIAGLFTILCLLYFWSNILQNVHHDKAARQWTDIVCFGIFAALSAYTQHFAMLTAALTGFFGLFKTDKRLRWKYLSGCALALVLYIPQIFITLYQISTYQGLEWLARPRYTFIIKYIQYLLNSSKIVIVALLIVFCIFFSINKIKENWKNILFFSALWLLPLCIGFGYSRWVSPVLQFSCLIFSWPFLLLSIGLCFKNSEKRILSTVIISLWSIILTATLIFKPFFPHREQVFETSSVETWKLYDRFGKKEVISWNNCDASKLKYYENKYNRSLQNDIFYNSDLKTLDSVLQHNGGHFLITTEVTPYEIEVIRHYFPQLQYRKDLQRSSVLVFSRNSDAIYGKFLFFNEKEIVSRAILPYNDTDEFVPLLDTNLQSFCPNKHDILTAEVQFTADSTVQEYHTIVIETRHNGKLLDWHSAALDNMPWGGEGKLILNLADVIDWPYSTKNHQIKIYLYNPHHVSGIHATHFTLRWRDGNKQKYAL